MINNRNGGDRAGQQDNGSSAQRPEDYSQRRFDQHGGQSGGHWHSQSASGFGAMGGTAQDSPQRYGGMSSSRNGEPHRGSSRAQVGPQRSGTPESSNTEQQHASSARHQVYEENQDNWRAQQMAQLDRANYESRRSHLSAEFEEGRRNRAQDAPPRSGIAQPPTAKE